MEWWPLVLAGNKTSCNKLYGIIHAFTLTQAKHNIWLSEQEPEHCDRSTLDASYITIIETY